MIYEDLQGLEIELPQAPPILPPSHFLCYTLSSGPVPLGSSLLSGVPKNSWAQPGGRENKAGCVQD